MHWLPNTALVGKFASWKSSNDFSFSKWCSFSAQYNQWKFDAVISKRSNSTFSVTFRATSTITFWAITFGRRQPAEFLWRCEILLEIRRRADEFVEVKTEKCRYKSVIRVSMYCTAFVEELLFCSCQRSFDSFETVADEFSRNEHHSVAFVLFATLLVTTGRDESFEHVDQRVTKVTTHYSLFIIQWLYLQTEHCLPLISKGRKEKLQPMFYFEEIKPISPHHLLRRLTVGFEAKRETDFLVIRINCAKHSDRANERRFLIKPWRFTCSLLKRDSVAKTFDPLSAEKAKRKHNR